MVYFVKFETKYKLFKFPVCNKLNVHVLLSATRNNAIHITISNMMHRINMMHDTISKMMHRIKCIKIMHSILRNEDRKQRVSIFLILGFKKKQ